jgi:hypothetical protein
MTGPQGPVGPQGAPGSFPIGTLVGEMQYWDGANWGRIVPPAPDDDWSLAMCAGAPRWLLRLRKGTLGCDDLIATEALTATTTLVPVNESYGFYPLSMILDGNTYRGGGGVYCCGDNGFVTDSVAGEITFEMASDRTLRGFVLWNDVNVSGEGVRKFELRLMDASGVDITPAEFPSQFSATSIVAPQEYWFPAVSGVRSVQMNVLESAARIEIREVALVSGT